MHSTPEHDRINKLFGSEMLRFRTNRECSRERFAEKLDCSSKHVQDIEKGETAPSFFYPFYMMALMKPHVRHEFVERMIREMRVELVPKELRRDGSLLGETVPA